MESQYSKTIEYLTELNQHHIVEEFKKRTDSEKAQFSQQILHLEKIYPGGIKEYIKRAKVLLNASKNHVNPYASFTPSIPEGIQVNIGDDEYFKLESLGFSELSKTGFVLVAGGLGERLGYNDIKIGIQTELVTKRVFIKIYIEYLLSYQARMRKLHNITDADFHVPLCIMTSDDTHLKTIALLEENNFYGIQKEHITIVKQEKVPALLNNDCDISLMKEKFLIDTKPHGHGDVHTLLHQHKVIENWGKMGKKWVVFFQDTNILVFNCLPSAIGVSKSEGYVINSITIPRKPGDALGGICKLTDDSNKSITLNVEYNQLDSLLKDKWNPAGDIPNEKGISYFPGNTNVLIFELDSYAKTLEKTKGLMPEFVNPKYADEKKNAFKSPTRLECMMQDYPQLLTENERVGFTMYERWFCFSTCKNNLKDGTDRMKKGLMAETSFSCEQDIYCTNVKILKDIFGKLEIIKADEIPEEKVNINGVDVIFGPKLVVYPNFAVTIEDLRNSIEGKILISNKSVLLLENRCTIKDLYLEGFLKVDGKEAVPEKVENGMRYEFVPLKEGEGENYEVIRGYRLNITNA